MSIYDLMVSRRTIRKFEKRKIPMQKLIELIDVSRFAPSAANLQPLRYLIVTQNEMRTLIFPNIAWAKYIHPDGTPQQGEEPAAYVLIFLDKTIQATGYEQLDIGLAVQNMMLRAWESGIGSCLIAAMNRKKIAEIVGIDLSKYDFKVMLCLGYVAEHPITEEMQDSVEYYKDESGVLHVPKRSCDELIIGKRE